MHRRRIPVAAAAAVGLLAAGTLLRERVARPFPGGGRADAAVARHTLDARVEMTVTDDTTRSGWRVHTAVSSAPEAAALGSGWVVLDVTGRRLHLLDAGLELVRSFGRPGEGPGELSRPIQIAVLGDSLVGVLDGMGARLQLFGADGAFRGRLPFHVPGCAGGLAGTLTPDPPEGFAVQGVCGGSDGLRWTAAKIGLDGRVEAIADTSIMEGGAVRPPFGRSLVSWRARLWVGTPDGCFTPVDEPRPHRVCVPVERPVPIADSVRTAMAGGRAGAPGPEVDLPAAWPPVVAARASSEGPMLLLPTPDGAGVQALLGEDGVLVLLRTRARAFAGPAGLLLSRPFSDGTGFRLEPWPERGVVGPDDRREDP